MATRGAKPKPTKLKQLEGNRAKLGKARIKVTLDTCGDPRMPPGFGEEERQLWTETVKAMPPGLFRAADTALLEVFAVAWAEFRQARRMVAKTGPLVQSPQGPIRNPMLAIMRDAARTVRLCASEMGLSPAARARLTNVDGPTDDPLALLLGDDLDPEGAWNTSPKTRQ